jgi:hypothetical protein
MSKAQLCREKAHECRLMALRANSADVQKQCLAVAAQWEELALEAERLDGVRGRHGLSDEA